MAYALRSFLSTSLLLASKWAAPRGRLVRVVVDGRQVFGPIGESHLL